jgi:trk system potassium uptake protein
MPKLNFKLILHIMGLLLLFNGGFMLIAVLVSWYYEDGITLQFLASSLIASFIGVF